VSLSLVVSGAIGLYFSYEETRSSLVSLQREKALTASVRIEQFLRDIENQLGWTTLPLVSASPAHAYPSSHVEFEGHGWGHGRGLGQYGALWNR